MSEITKDFIKFVAEVIVLLVVLSVLFGEEGIASNTFYYMIYVEPILLQNWLTSALSIGSNSPGEFMATAETTGQAYTIKIYQDKGIMYAQVIPPSDYYLQAKFATIRAAPIISSCRIYDQEIKLKKGVKQTITVEKVLNPDGTCNMYVGAPVINIPIDRYPHVTITKTQVVGSASSNPQAGDTFDVSLKYTHDMRSDGAIHLHWPDNEADFVSITNCPANAWNNGIMEGNEFVECGNENNHIKDGLEVIVELKAKVNDVNLFYRAWDWSKDEHCRGDVFDYDREPLGGICSSNCATFPDDTIKCETFKKTV